MNESSKHMPFPDVSADRLAWLTTDQMIEVDRVMIEDLHIELIQMMENAGRSLAILSNKLVSPASADVYVGPGGNGGGGLVAARHLAVAGVDVSVIAAGDTEKYTPIPRHQLDGVQRMGIPVSSESTRTPDVIVDAMLGYSLKGAPRPPFDSLIANANASGAPIIALDTPSGLDTATGETVGEVIDATATLTLAMPKVGLRDGAEGQLRKHLGELYLATISVPNSVYDGLGFDISSPFGVAPILRVVI